MDETKKITFNREKMKKFRKAYNKALMAEKEYFIFEGVKFLTSYAYYVLQYVESKFL